MEKEDDILTILFLILFKSNKFNLDKKLDKKL